MYLEDLTAHIRGDNALLSHSFNNSQAENLQPFARPSPSSPYERAWGPLFDAIWNCQINLDLPPGEEALPPYWLENMVLQLVNETTSASSQKIAALEARLQTLTSVAYSLFIQQLRVKGNLTSLDADVQGQQQTPLAKLHVNGSQTVLGFICVIILFFCVAYAAELRDGLMPRGDRYLIAGDALDLMCLMRGSSLPGLLAEPNTDPLIPDARRDQAENINVV
jgi:hypothetical protein